MAIIATGATATQAIPELGRSEAEVLVFQRAPTSVDVRADAPFDTEWFAQIASEPGWQQTWLDTVTANWEAYLADPTVALTARYSQLCKRPGFHDEYLQSFNRPRAHLVDADGRGVQRITEDGVVARGEEHPVDCFIDATDEAENAWVDMIVEEGNPFGSLECTPGCCNNEGTPGGKRNKHSAGYPQGTVARFRFMLSAERVRLGIAQVGLAQ